VKWFSIQGWFDYDSLYRQVVADAKDGYHFAEIGAWLGRSTAYLADRIANSGKDIRLTVVDTWEGSNERAHREKIAKLENSGQTLFGTFQDNMQACGVANVLSPLRLPSVEAAKTFADKSLDFVFIDGDHAYESVCADIDAWLPKVKPGGLLAGHDYPYPPVARAVKEKLDGVQLSRPRSWKYQVPLANFPDVVNYNLTHYTQRLEAGETFSFSRWGDGEWLSVLAKRLSNTANCDSHRFFPAMGRELQEVLKSDPPYEIGMQQRALDLYGRDICRFLQAHLPKRQWHFADVFHKASCRGRLAPLLQLLKKLPLLLVGPGYLTNIDKIIPFQEFVEVPRKNCYLQLNRIENEILQASKSLPKPFVCSLSASMPAEILIHRLYPRLQESTFLIDFGSLYDPFVGYNTRGYHRAMPEKIYKSNLQGLI
jgi:predicted O-methyltransferase YrrM